MGLSENVGYIPNEIAIFHRDNDQQNHWVNRGLANIFRHTHITSPVKNGEVAYFWMMRILVITIDVEPDVEPDTSSHGRLPGDPRPKAVRSRNSLGEKVPFVTWCSGSIAS